MAKQPKTNAEGWALVCSKIKKAHLAREIGRSKQLLHLWREVPLKYVLDVEKASGVPRAHILPEMAALFKNDRA